MRRRRVALAALGLALFWVGRLTAPEAKVELRKSDVADDCVEVGPAASCTPSGKRATGPCIRSSTRCSATIPVSTARVRVRTPSAAEVPGYSKRGGSIHAHRPCVGCGAAGAAAAADFVPDFPDRSRGAVGVSRHALVRVPVQYRLASVARIGVRQPRGALLRVVQVRIHHSAPAQAELMFALPSTRAGRGWPIHSWRSLAASARAAVEEEHPPSVNLPAWNASPSYSWPRPLRHRPARGHPPRPGRPPSPQPSCSPSWPCTAAPHARERRLIGKGGALISRSLLQPPSTIRAWARARLRASSDRRFNHRARGVNSTGFSKGAGTGEGGNQKLIGVGRGGGPTRPTPRYGVP